MESKILIAIPNLRLQVLRRGVVVEDRIFANHVMDGCLDAIGDFLLYPGRVYTPAYSANYIALDTSADASTDGMTAPVVEVFRSRITNKFGGARKATMQHFVASSEANGNTILAVCLMSAAAGGIMLARALHTAVAKDVSTSLLYSWELTVGRG
jgi:hypothetical protein